VVTGTHTDNMPEPPVVADGAVSQFQWAAATLNCSSVTDSWAADSTVEIHRDTGDLDFFFCSATAIGPTAAAWQPYVSVDFDYCPMRVTVHVTTSQFVAGPVSPPILTSGGSRVVNLDPTYRSDIRAHSSAPHRESLDQAVGEVRSIGNRDSVSALEVSPTRSVDSADTTEMIFLP
jgi:hypothetical protein